MAIPRVAVCQAPYVRDSDAALRRMMDHLHQAASRGVDVVVFPEWCLGLNPVEVIPNRHTEKISRVARELNLMVITGSIRALEPESGKKQQRSLVIEPDGTLAGSQAKILFHPTERPWFEPGAGIQAISTRWGRIVILPGLDALDADLWLLAQELSPDLLVMAANPHTLSERTEIQELAVERSQAMRGMVVLAPLQGRFSGSAYVGGALVCHQGRVLGITNEQETILIAGDAEAPLIQLGVTDATAYVPLSRPLDNRHTDPKCLLGPEAERRVLVDWGLLAESEFESQVAELFFLAQDNPRWTALSPARPGYSVLLGRWLDHGAAGAFLYPGISHMNPWDDAIRQLGKELTRAKKPCLVHVGPGPAPLRFDAPILWDEFLMEFPDVPLLLKSMGQCPPFIEQALTLGERHPQVYLETSRAPAAAVKEAIRTVGPDRVVFGSGGMAQDFRREWEKIERLEAEISQDTFQRIVSGNARKLFFPSESVDRRWSNPVRSVRRPG